MRIRSLRLPGMGIGLGLLTVLLIGVATASGRAATSVHHPVFTPGAAGLGGYVQQGVPAISPRTNLASSTGAHFTNADVQQYLAQVPPEYAVPGAAAPQIVSVQFLPAHAVDALIGETIGVPANTLLCLVTLTGTFQSTNVPLGATAYVYHSGVMVFNATTGNLLVSSVGA